MGHGPTLIEIARGQKDLTQARLAQLANVDNRTLRVVEQRQKRINIRQLSRIVKTLELDMDEVLEDLAELYGSNEVAS